MNKKQVLQICKVGYFILLIGGIVPIPVIEDASVRKIYIVVVIIILAILGILIAKYDSTIGKDIAKTQKEENEKKNEDIANFLNHHIEEHLDSTGNKIIYKAYKGESPRLSGLLSTMDMESYYYYNDLGFVLEIRSIDEETPYSIVVTTNRIIIQGYIQISLEDKTIEEAEDYILRELQSLKERKKA